MFKIIFVNEYFIVLLVKIYKCMNNEIFSTLQIISKLAKYQRNQSEILNNEVCGEYELNYLQVFFNSDEAQAKTLAVLIDLYLDNETVSVRSVLESLKLNYTHAGKINNNLKVFIQRDLIYPSSNPKTNPLTNYTITPKLIDAIYSDDNTILQETPINSIPDILVQFQSKLRHQTNGTVSAEELFDWTINMHHKVGIKTSLSEFIVSKKLNSRNATLLTFICLRSLQQTSTSMDLVDYIESVELSFQDIISLKKSFKDRTHIFFRLQLINLQRNGRFWTQYEFDLTNRCLTLFEGKYCEFEEECTIDDLLDKVLQHGLNNMPDRYLKMLNKLSNSRR